MIYKSNKDIQYYKDANGNIYDARPRHDLARKISSYLMRPDFAETKDLTPIEAIEVREMCYSEWMSDYQKVKTLLYKEFPGRIADEYDELRELSLSKFDGHDMIEFAQICVREWRQYEKDSVKKLGQLGDIFDKFTREGLMNDILPIFTYTEVVEIIKYALNINYTEQMFGGILRTPGDIIKEWLKENKSQSTS